MWISWLWFNFCALFKIWTSFSAFVSISSITDSMFGILINTHHFWNKMWLCSIWNSLKLHIWRISFVLGSIIRERTAISANINVRRDTKYFFCWWWWLRIFVIFFLLLFGSFSSTSFSSFFISSYLPRICTWFMIFSESYMSWKFSILCIVNVFNCYTEYHLSKSIKFFLSFMDIIFNSVTIFIYNSSILSSFNINAFFRNISHFSIWFFIVIKSILIIMRNCA